jgi:hypothetical protein
MPTGACSSGYKLRSREGASPKSLSVVESLKSYVGMFLRGVSYLVCDRVSDMATFSCHPVYDVGLPFYSPRWVDVQGLRW